MFKIVLLGSEGVGKSAITIKYLRNKFIEDYDPTIEEIYRKDIIIGEELQTIQIHDTAGHEEFNILNEKYIKNGDGFIFIYSVTNEESFRIIKEYYNSVKTLINKKRIHCVLIGNKRDLYNDRVVDISEGEQLAMNYNCEFYETSAKLDTVRLDVIFNRLIKQLCLLPKSTSIRRTRSIDKCTLL